MKIKRINIVAVITWCALFLVCNMTIAQETTSSQSETGVSIGFNIKTSTASVSSINGASMESHATDNLSNALSGQLTGVYTQQQGGEPGSDGSSVLLRGFRTLSNGVNSPLILVDNIIGDYTFLDPSEIESIQMLKDAAATAIYGQRGANGVILITTKRGKTGSLNVKVNAQFGLQHLVGLPKFLNSAEYAYLYNEARYNEGDTSPFYSDDDILKYADQTGNNIYTHPSVDYLDQFLKNITPIQRYSMNFSGGSDFIKYNVVLGLMDQNGFYEYAVKEPKYSTNARSTRYNMRANLDINISPRMDLIFNVAAQMIRKKSPYGGTSTIWSTLMHERPNEYPVYTPSGNLGGTSSNFNNPVGLMSRSGYREVNDRNIQAMVEATHQLDFITNGLSITGSAAYNGFNTYGYQKKQEYSVYSVDEYMNETQYGVDRPLSDGTDMSNGMNYIVSAWASLNYNKMWDQHSLRVAAMTYFDRTFIPKQSAYSNINYVLNSSYSFMDRYNLSGTLTYSGNDDFAPGDRFGWFYAISGSWDIHKEDFLTDKINLMKLRTSYGLTGNNRNSGSRRYLYQTQYATGNGYPFGTNNSWNSGTYELQSGNPFYTWEKARQFNVGLEMEVVNRIYMSFDYFIDNRFDILTSPTGTLPDIFGGTLSMTNTGEVRTRGYEAILGYNDKFGDFKLNVSLNLSHFDNEVLENSEVAGLAENMSGKGKPSYGEWGLVADGFFYDEADIANSTPQHFGTYAPGDVKYKDMNKDNVIDENDATRLGGTGIPNIMAGVNINLGYKGFDLGVNIVGHFNRMVWLPAEFHNAIPNGGKLAKGAYDSWAYYTDQYGNLVDNRANAKYPRLLTSVSNNNTQNSTLWWRDADFIRVKNIELGYTFPETLTSKIKISNLRVFANAYNPFLLYDELQIGDPEYPGACIWSYGKTAIYSFGLSLTF